MSGYTGDSNPSKLGGGVPGKFEAAFGNTMVGSEVAMNRRKLRKAFRTNKIKVNGSITNKRSVSGPFRTAFNLGDPLGRQNFSCGGCNQSNKDCNKVVGGYNATQVPLENGNSKFVADSSLYTKFKHLSAVNLTYNDKTGGGDESNASFSDINRVRQG